MPKNRLDLLQLVKRVEIFLHQICEGRGIQVCNVEPLRWEVSINALDTVLLGTGNIMSCMLASSGESNLGLVPQPPNRTGWRRPI